ncbi:uncharacterized protein UMAG_01234 [Mycosarcoma maydis]|uniref:F-box domain-containing protein n=1 Tax=Mycosarcoma maydis TaxID=5270 RepID=G3CK49_MYCMD|nr:uncharacterized protein UMAG_01234 [Ustilago maydis 521]AEN25810.1 hypothetical protein um01234 [Ustilago maydis]KIS71334.1 hypothetical protein UMAG_01234 [Ustilago maydis 521]|eukprot:XP_011387168.1 hypothetical protein UMAG_01234 [Ustilago maydis 521]
MSGISRLLRWAPFLWAACKLTNSSGGTRRPKTLCNQSGVGGLAGPIEFLHTLSFPARTVVLQAHRPSQVNTPTHSRSPDSTLSEDLFASKIDRESPGWLARTLLRTRRPLVYEGWQWENPHRLPIRLAHRAFSTSRLILNHARSAFVTEPLPAELQLGIMLAVRHPVRRSGSFSEADILLVCRVWNALHRRHFWEKRWLNIRPRSANWASIGDRIKALVRNADVIHNVKLDGVLTDILPTSLEDTVRQCPDFAELATCNVQRIKIGKLDNLNELLLKQILLFHQDKIRHFEFRVGDSVLFLGRSSLFAGSVLLLPNIRRVTVDMSEANPADYLEEMISGSAGQVSFFIAELVGRQNMVRPRQVEIRLVFHPKSVEASRPELTGAHILLAAQICDFTREKLKNVAGLDLVVSFQAPFRKQVALDLAVLRTWARENSILLINT